MLFIYFSLFTETNTVSEEKKAQINNLKQQFKISSRELVFNDFSVKNVSEIRPLFEVVDGGYLFRYEFDLTIGYNETTINNIKMDKAIDIEIKDDSGAIILDYVIE